MSNDSQPDTHLRILNLLESDYEFIPNSGDTSFVVYSNSIFNVRCKATLMCYDRMGHCCDLQINFCADSGGRSLYHGVFANKNDHQKPPNFKKPLALLKNITTVSKLAIIYSMLTKGCMFSFTGKVGHFEFRNHFLRVEDFNKDVKFTFNVKSNSLNIFSFTHNLSFNINADLATSFLNNPIPYKDNFIIDEDKRRELIELLCGKNVYAFD